jgi:hypothetical protein
VGHVPRLAAFESLEIFAPGGIDRRRVCQPRFIELFNVIGVAAGELGGFEKLADQISAHVTTGEEGRLAAVPAGDDQLAEKNPVNYSLGVLRRGNPKSSP